MLLYRVTLSLSMIWLLVAQETTYSLDFYTLLRLPSTFETWLKISILPATVVQIHTIPEFQLEFTTQISTTMMSLTASGVSQDCITKYDNEFSPVWVNIALVIRSAAEVHLL